MPSDRSNPPSAGRGERGSAMLLVLPMLLVMIAAATSIFTMTRSGMQFASAAAGRQRSFYIADGGLKTAMTRLHADRATASVTTAYTATGNGSIAGGTFSYTIVQDPAFPTDATRKQITSNGTQSNSTTSLVEQAQVFPTGFTTTPGTPGTNGGYPFCDLAILSDTGTAGIQSLAQVGGLIGWPSERATVYGNNTVTIKSVVSAGQTALDSYGDYRSVNDTRVEAQPLGPLSLVGTGLLATMAHSTLIRGGNLTYVSPYVHIDIPLLPALLSTGIHFGNAAHGVQQSVPKLPFPMPDWTALEQAATAVVDQNHLPFGSWESGSNTWVVTGTQNFGTASYFVRGNVRFQNVTLAMNATFTIAATGTIEVGTVSLLQMNIGGLLAVGLGGNETLRLIGKRNVFIGRGMSQTADQALLDTSLDGIRDGLTLNATALLSTRIAAYSQTGDVWVKAATANALAAPRINLVAKGNSIYAVSVGAISPPTTYCQSF